MLVKQSQIKGSYVAIQTDANTGVRTGYLGATRQEAINLALEGIQISNDIHKNLHKYDERNDADYERFVELEEARATGN